MKSQAIDWQEFIHGAELYRRLPVGARAFFVDNVQPSQGVPNAVMGEWREALLDSKLMVAGVQGKNARVDPRLGGFCKFMRSLRRHRIFDSPSRETFRDFVYEHLEGAELRALFEKTTSYYYYGNYDGVPRLYSRVCSAEWLKQFLAAKSPDWEKPYRIAGAAYFSADTLKATQGLLRKLMEAVTPVPMTQLAGLCPELRPDLLAASILAGIRYLLFFPALSGAELEPALGLWPTVARKLRGPVSDAPEPVAASNEFQSPFLMEDMTAILAECAVDPLREPEDFIPVLQTLPEWVDKEFHFAPEERVGMTLAFLDQYGFLARKGARGRDSRMEVTESGSGWLGLRDKDRLKTILDGLRGGLKKQESAFGDGALSLALHVIAEPSEGQLRKIASALATPFAGMDVDVFVRLRDFIDYYRERDNPLPAIRRDKDADFRIGGSFVEDPSPEELEEAWEGLVIEFLCLRLLPLGGAKIGQDSGGAVCFAMTDAGRYLVGAAEDFQLGGGESGRIAVQPNFDVVFLAASSKAESEIARFSERKGRRLGTLFKLTRQSILAAAAAGLTGERVLEILREHCSGEIPGNVAFEISAWSSQYRRISMRPVLLIQCPDEATSDRVVAAAGNKVTRLTATMLELRDTKAQATLARKLREAGIFSRS
jgi:hypothetical protein